MRYSYKTRGTCSSQIDFDINGDVITKVIHKALPHWLTA